LTAGFEINRALNERAGWHYENVNRRTAVGLAWAAPGAGALMTVAVLVLGVMRGDSGENLTGLSDDIIWFLSLALFVPVGALIARRHPRNPVGWILIAIGLSEIISKFAYEYAARALIVAPGSLPGGNAMAWLSSWFWVYELALFPFMILLFPTGRSLSRRWSWLGWISISCSVVFTLFMLMLWPYRGARFLRDVESFGVERLRSIEEFVFALFPVVMICLALSLASLIVRYLRSAGLERQQLKWIAFVAGIGAANIAVNDFVLSPLGIESDFIQLLSETIGGPGTFAIAAGIAILRYRLYDIDRIINRTLVYAVLTAMIGGAYASDCSDRRRPGVAGRAAGFRHTRGRNDAGGGCRLSAPSPADSIVRGPPILPEPLQRAPDGSYLQRPTTQRSRSRGPYPGPHCDCEPHAAAGARDVVDPALTGILGVQSSRKSSHAGEHRDGLSCVV
jgi:hypothetical protein